MRHWKLSPSGTSTRTTEPLVYSQTTRAVTFGMPTRAHANPLPSSSGASSYSIPSTTSKILRLESRPPSSAKSGHTTADAAADVANTLTKKVHPMNRFSMIVIRTLWRKVMFRHAEGSGAVN